MCVVHYSKCSVSKLKFYNYMLIKYQKAENKGRAKWGLKQHLLGHYKVEC